MNTAQAKNKAGSARGILAITAILLASLVVGGYLALSPVREAKQLEQDLLDRHATVPEYIPAADGSIAPARMELFLAVRRALLEKTRNTQETYERIDQAMTREDLSVRDGADTFRDLMHALPRMIEFYSARNGELLERGMGLGEYFYIYVVVYGQRLCPPDIDGESCKFVTRRTTRELTQILRNQLHNPSSRPDAAMIEALEREIDALVAAEIPLPWQGGLPGSIRVSIEPYRERLDPLFCLATRELELGQKNRNPGGIGD